MTHKRNVEGIRVSAQRKRQEALNRADEAILLLVKEKRPVNFKSVAETAGISIPFLYQTEALKQRIIHLRDQTTTPVQLKLKERPSDASKDAVIETLRLRVKESEAENRSLKKQLEVVYGQLLHKGQPIQLPLLEPARSFSEGEVQLRQLLDQANTEKNELAEVNQSLKKQNREFKEKLLALEDLKREVQILKKQKQSYLNEILMLKAGQPISSSLVSKPKTKKRTEPG